MDQPASSHNASFLAALSRITQNKVDHDDLWDYGEDDGLQDDFNSDDEGIYVSINYKNYI